MAGGLDWMVFRVPSNQKYSTILWFYDSDTLFFSWTSHSTIIFQQSFHVPQLETHIKWCVSPASINPIHMFNSLCHLNTVNKHKQDQWTIGDSSKEKSELQGCGGVNLWGLSHPAVLIFRSTLEPRWSCCFIPQHGGDERIKFIFIIFLSSALKCTVSGMGNTVCVPVSVVVVMVKSSCSKPV